MNTRKLVAIQAAIDWIASNMVAGAVLKFGARAYWKSAEWVITSNRVTLRGSGVSTQIVEMSPNGNGIVFRNCDRPTLEKMYIWSNLTKSAGTSAVWFDNCHDAYIQDFRIEQHHHGIRCTANWQQYLLYISHGDIGHCDGDGMRLGDMGTLVQGIFVDNVHITACNVGISQFNVSGFQSLNIDIIQCGSSFTAYPYGVIKTGNMTSGGTVISGLPSTSDMNEYMVVTFGSYRGAVTDIINGTSVEVWPPLPSTSTGVSIYFFNQVVAGAHIGLVCDTSDEVGMKLYTNGGIIADQKFYYARSGANGVTNDQAHGIHIVSNGCPLSEIRDIQFTALWGEQNGGNAIRIENVDGSAHHIGFIQSSISDNSLATNNLRDGIYIGAGVSHISIIGGHCSNAPLIAHPNQQRYGIFIASGSTDHLIISDVDVTGNVTGGISNGASGSNVKINTIGYVNSNRGTNSISATTSVVVPHGLAEQPALSGISVIPTSDPGSGIRYWVSAVTSTNFTLTTSASASFTFAWEAKGPTVK